jgi:PPOX class probable FMN-dependent enzyme
VQQFAEIITTRARLREILPESSAAAVLHKQVDHINEPARRFIGSSPFLVIATKGSDGLLDVSPKGDPAGFVEVLDEHTLIIPDRLGNHRLDSYENILVDPSVALIFMVPGHTETLRVSGKGRIVFDEGVRARHAVNGKAPVLALAVDVEEVFMHCSKSFVRSRLWQPAQWPDRNDTPSLAEWVVCTVAHDRTVDHMQTVHDNDAKNRLY